MLAAVLAVFAVLLASLSFAASASATADNGDGGTKYTICHHDNGARQYTPNWVSVNSIVEGGYFLDWNGHGDHSEDIIPNIYDPDGVLIFAAQGDQSYLPDCVREDEELSTTAKVYTDPVTVCTTDGVTHTIVGYGEETVTFKDESDRTAAEAEALATATTEAQQDRDAQLRALGEYTTGACPTNEKFGGQATWTATVDICYNNAFETNTATATKSVTGYATSAEAYAAAERLAQDDVNGQMAVFLAARPGYTVAPADHVCTTAVDAAEVVVPLPATVPETAPVPVTVPEPAKVPVPATVPIPATVPAGDGSTAPQVPVTVLALLALATVGSVTAGLRLARNR